MQVGLSFPLFCGIHETLRGNFAFLHGAAVGTYSERIFSLENIHLIGKVCEELAVVCIFDMKRSSPTTITIRSHGKEGTLALVNVSLLIL